MEAPEATQIPRSPGDTRSSLPADSHVVLFDGVCNLCNVAVQFLLDHEREVPGASKLSFAPIQSEIAWDLLTRVFDAERAAALRDGASGSGDPDSIVFVDGDRGYTHSTAALRIARHLRAPYRWLGAAAILVPRPLRDVVYRFIVRNRYRWFGKTDTCRVPTPELRARFLA